MINEQFRPKSKLKCYKIFHLTFECQMHVVDRRKVRYLIKNM